MSDTAFEITEESVQIMKELAQKIPDTVNEVLQANNEVINCYEQLKKTVGPYTRQIESIVKDLK